MIFELRQYHHRPRQRANGGKCMADEIIPCQVKMGTAILGSTVGAEAGPGPRRRVNDGATTRRGATLPANGDCAGADPSADGVACCGLGSSDPSGDPD